MYCRRHSEVKANCMACPPSSKSCAVCDYQLKHSSKNCAACKLQMIKHAIAEKSRKCRLAQKKPCRNLVDLMLKYSNTVIIGQHKFICSRHAIAKSNCRVCVRAKQLMPNSPDAACSRQKEINGCGGCLCKRSFYKPSCFKQQRPKA